MHDPSFMALALIVSEERTLTQNHHERKRTVKSGSRLKIEQRINLYSSRCMHDPSFMALALIVSEERT